MGKGLLPLLYTGLLLFLSAPVAQAGNKYSDSLKNELNKAGLPDSARIEILLQLGWNYSFVRADTARILLRQASALAMRHKNLNKKGEALAYIGTSFSRTDHYDSALYYYRQAESCFSCDGSPEARLNIVIGRMSMATVALAQGYHQTAIKYYLEAIDSLTKSSFAEKWTNLVTAYTNIGLVYNDQEQYDKALAYQQKALGLCGSHPVEIAKTTQVQQLVALDLVNLKRPEQARKALHRADSLSGKANLDYLFAMQYGVEGRYYLEIKNYDSAVSAFNRSITCARHTNNLFQEANMLQQLGKVYLDRKNYRQSLGSFLASLSISQKLGDKIRQASSLKYLSELYVLTQNDARAVQYYQQYVHLNDSLQKADARKKIYEIESAYQVQKKEDSIALLQKSNQLQMAALGRKQTLSTALIAGCVLLLLLAIMIYMNFKRKNELLRQASELHEQRIRKLEKEQQLVAIQSVLQGQEEERSRLARDLHDGVGGLLSGIKLSLSTIKGNVFLSEQNAQSVNQVIVQLDHSIGELRRVSHNMMPEALIRYGLEEALENYCENLNLSGNLKVQLQTYGLEQRMEQSTEIVLYRIVQELLNNIIRHAGAANVLIQLVRENERFSLTVEDDGRGFDVRTADQRSGAGLANIRARAGYLKGTVDIQSSPGEGTSVNVEGSCA
jgi:signal transduction histidine kinase